MLVSHDDPRLQQQHEPNLVPVCSVIALMEADGKFVVQYCFILSLKQQQYSILADLWKNSGANNSNSYTRTYSYPHFCLFQPPPSVSNSSSVTGKYHQEGSLILCLSFFILRLLFLLVSGLPHSLQTITYKGYDVLLRAIVHYLLSVGNPSSIHPSPFFQQLIVQPLSSTYSQASPSLPSSLLALPKNLTIFSTLTIQTLMLQVTITTQRVFSSFSYQLKPSIASCRSLTEFF